MNLKLALMGAEIALAKATADRDAIILAIQREELGRAISSPVLRLGPVEYRIGAPCGSGGYNARVKINGRPAFRVTLSVCAVKNLIERAEQC